MVFAQDMDGDTVLHAVAELGSADAIGYLLSGLPAELAKQLMKMGGSNGRTPQMKAACNEKDNGVIRELMEFIRRNSSPASNNANLSLKYSTY